MTQRHIIRLCVCAISTFWLGISQSAHGEPVSFYFSDAETTAPELSPEITFSEASFGEDAEAMDAPYVPESRQRNLSVRALATALLREQPTDATLISNPAHSGQSIKGSDFDFDYGAGIDLSLVTGPIFGNTGAEIRYLGIDGWDANAAAATAGITTIVHTTPVTTLVDGYRIDSRLASDLNSFEANFRRAICDSNDWLTILVGYRQLEFDDAMSNRFTQGVANATYGVRANNRLYGGQVGADMCFWSSDRARLTGIIKGGVYGNAAKHTTRVSQGALNASFRDSDGATSFIGELGVYGEWDITCNLQVVGGYQLLWLEEVALATEQIAATNPVAFDGIDSGGSVYFQGFSLGFALTW